jgi:hypothetical protein
MYKHDIQNMYDGSEYLQNILFKNSKNNNIINIKSCIVVTRCHENLQSMIENEK